MGAHRRLTTTLALCGALLLPATASAQLLSPGALSRAHRELEGLKRCLDCHEPGNKLSNARCLKCHDAIARRVNGSRGLHGKLPRSASCAICHREHRGVNASLIDWGAGGEKGFDHKRTGWPLRGAHKKAKCASCHDSRLLHDGDAKQLQKKGRGTWLGLATRCASCHFDEHRGQLGQRCDKCHVEKSFEPAPGFDHGKTDFALTGRHRKVDCKECHESTADARTPKTAFPAPVHTTFATYSDVAHNNCVDCHRDPHRGQMGNRCARCHSTRGWKVLNKAARDTGFHDKSGFPLRGGHVGVACKTCHGPFRGRAAVFKGLPHARCSDCHVDGHGGQLPSPKGARGPDCKRCHSVRAFAPTTFGVDDHKKARFELEGAHRAVPCSECHKPGRRTRVSRSDRAWLRVRGRSAETSSIHLRLPDASDRCESCHTDPHREQFDDKVKARGCNACHQASSFTDLVFDHDKDARFPLEGRHEKVACGACHRPDDKLGGAVRFRPLESACADCHADVHAAQFADANTRTDCARCHTTAAFPRTKFSHDDDAFTSFALKGRHRDIACAKCHPAVEVKPGVTTAWYRGVPTTCAGCHVDQHEGRFSGYEP